MAVTLSELMDFDVVIRVDHDGTVTQDLSIPAPDLDVDDDAEPHVSSPWSLLTGYTRQHGYRGAVLHPSEQIGAGLERDILATPGLYVALVVEVWPDDEDGEPELAGWTVAHIPCRFCETGEPMIHNLETEI